jgi:hypothetical protein
MGEKQDKHVSNAEKIKVCVCSHISKVLVTENHFTCASSSKNYTERGKTLIQLYRDY